MLYYQNLQALLLLSMCIC